MAGTVFGQHIGRDDRIRQYENWSGSSYVPPSWQPCAQADPEIEQRFDSLSVQTAIKEIRTLLETTDRVHVDYACYQFTQAVAAGLSDYELSRTDFGRFDKLIRVSRPCRS